MSIFGNGVGGGLLATAGAIGGLGQGITQVGEAQQKTNLAQKMNDMQQTREEAITRLQGQQQSQLEEQRAGHEEQRTEKEIAGHSAVAQFERGSVEKEAEAQRSFGHTENQAKFASEEKRTQITADSRVAAAKTRATASQKPPKGWTPKNVTLQGTVSNGTIIPGKQMQVMTHPDGSAYVQVGDRLIPYNGAATDGLGMDPASLRRAPAKEVQTLLQSPTAVLRSGMSAKDSFVKRNGYLPGGFMAAENAARQNAQPVGGGGGGADADDESSPSQDAQDTTSSVPMAGTSE